MTEFLPTWLVDMVVAMLCFFVLYDAVTGFDRSLVVYHSELASKLLFFSVLMILPHIIFGLPSLVFRVDGWGWGILIIVLLVSTYLAESSSATDKLRLIFSLLVFGLALRCWLRLAGAHVVPLVLLAICLFHAAILIFVLQQAPNANPAQPYDHSWVPYHAHIRHFAYHGMVAACAGVALVFLGRPLRLAGVLLAAMAVTGIFYFGARGALLGWSVFVISFALISRRYRDILAISGLVLALAMTSAYALTVHFAQSPFTGGILNRVESVEALVHTTGRIEIWLDALKVAVQQPWFGHGLDAYWTSRCCWKGSVQPHNTLVQWLMEFGVLGTGAVLWAFWCLFGKRLVLAFAQGTSAPELASLLSLFAGIFVFGLVDGMFYHAIPLLMFAILCTLLYRATDSADLAAPPVTTTPGLK